MKSSSRFFPARLISAEVLEGFAEDVYLIKPNNSKDKSVELALTHLTLLRDGEPCQPSGPSIVLVHGSYQNRRLWLSERGPCIARSLAASGFDVWLLDMRGHGLSPLNLSYAANTLADYARYDLPAVNMFVSEKAGQPVNWLGYGTGAGGLLTALALGSLSRPSLGVVMGVGVPFYRAKWSRIPGVSRLFMARRMAANAGFGPEPEPLGFLSALVRENHWLAVRGEGMGLDLWAKLATIEGCVHWLSTPEQLSDLDSELLSLQQGGRVRGVLGDDWLETQLSAENIATVLTNQNKIDSLVSTITDTVQGGVLVYGVSSSGKATSAA